MRILSVVGTRPNFMKLAPVARAFAAREDVEHIIVHTGQHYDAMMSGAFFDELEIPPPQYALGVGSGTHTETTARVMQKLEPVLVHERPDLVLVYGDVNSTVAAAMTAAQRGIRVVHVEAGLRSRDRTMPEELNRLVTDHIADVLLAPSPDAVDNLRAEGIKPASIHFVGNLMIDTLVHALPRTQQRSDASRAADIAKGAPYVVTTLHRPSNVDDADRLRDLIEALEELSREVPVHFAMHPRTRQRLHDMGLTPNGGGDLNVLRPLSYLEMLRLVTSAGLVITDSGGLQEETSFLGIPCITLRRNTERPITCSQGTNELVPPMGDAMLSGARRVLRNGPRERPVIEKWDGRAAERVVEVLCDGVRH
jgi:UDP-N-acetylglucosamine 2-epimerase (non-hydrolysing)